ncbi:MAG TPA: hypothetical protein VMG10_34165 [Gemmataceae bacterium]|nr:hypothetical protein [Gemmataceae bacterium]
MLARFFLQGSGNLLAGYGKQDARAALAEAMTEWRMLLLLAAGAK